LFLSDRSLDVYRSKGGTVSYVTSIEWQDPSFESAALHIIDKECEAKPVVILNDMVEQHYRKERLPKVSAMDKAQVLKRRLQVAFSNYPVRAALPSKQKSDAGVSTKNTASMPQGGLYLFAAVPSSEALNKTLALLQQSQANIVGFGLLPVESASMVQALAKKLGGEEKGKAQWAIFIGQHQSGGLRQVITRNGELALTRMTSLEDTNLDAGAWARDVVNELQSTMSYLTRFGYGGEDILDIIIISEEAAAKHLKAMIDIPCRLHIVLAQEAAKHLGIKLKSQESARHADGLHAGWVAKKPKLTLPMDARQISAITKPRQAAMMAMLVLLGAFAFMGYQIFNGTVSVLSTSSDLNTAKKRLQVAESEYQAEVTRQEQLGIDVQLIQGSIALYEEKAQEGIQILPMIEKIGQGLGGAMKIDAMKVIAQEPARGGAQGRIDPADDADKGEQYEVYLQLSFRPDIPPEAAVNEVNKLKTRLEGVLPEYEVEIKKQAFDMSTSAVFMGESGQVTESDIKKADYTAELSIKGAL
jgi:hypothetical protein